MSHALFQNRQSSIDVPLHLFPVTLCPFFPVPSPHSGQFLTWHYFGFIEFSLVSESQDEAVQSQVCLPSFVSSVQTPIYANCQTWHLHVEPFGLGRSKTVVVLGNQHSPGLSFSRWWLRTILSHWQPLVPVLKARLRNSLMYARAYASVIPETHKGLKRVTRVQCSWIFTFTIFGNLSVRYTFSTKWPPRDHHADVLRQEFSISRLKTHR